MESLASAVFEVHRVLNAAKMPPEWVVERVGGYCQMLADLFEVLSVCSLLSVHDQEL